MPTWAKIGIGAVAIYGLWKFYKAIADSTPESSVDVTIGTPLNFEYTS